MPHLTSSCTSFFISSSSSLGVRSHVSDANSLEVNLSFLLESLENLVGLLIVSSVDKAGHVLNLVSDELALFVDVHFKSLFFLDVLASGWVSHLHVKSNLGVGLALSKSRVLLGTSLVWMGGLGVLLVLELWLLLHHHGSLHVKWVVLHTKHGGLSS
jgi:hypothetical protein